ncbi:MAG: peptidase [Candidatus Marinimicrobia bacterium]|nr:peptidase [Candidatus Neomarinimicrobiota bacterium]
MKHSYKSRVNFSFLTTVVVIAIIITFPSVKNLYSATKDTYRIIENKFRIFNQMIQYVNEYYYDEVDLEKIWDGAFHGFMEKLDPHSVYIPPKKQEEIDEIFRGKFQGIGIEFDILDGYITVIAPVADSPSERAGLHPGDKIIEIDGEDAYGITKNEVMKTLRGPKGTSVDLTIARIGQDSFPVTIIRDVIPIYSVRASLMLDNQTGYIWLTRFTATSSEEMKNAIKKLDNLGMKRMILDLRNNSGGFLEQAAEIANMFITSRDTLVYTIGKHNNTNEVFMSKPSKGRSDFPLIILLNRGSASASEIVAGAVQDLDRGLIIGETSFGKGLVQRQLGLRDGSAIRVTIARYYTPSGRLIQRHFEDGNTREYYSELYNKDREALIDSLKELRPKYKTRAGRIVYGGGGITPDEYIPYELNLNKETQKIVGNQNRPIFNWSTKFVSEFGDSLGAFENFKETWNINDEDYTDFLNYLIKLEINPDTTEVEIDEAYIKNLIKSEIAGAKWGKDMQWGIRLMQDNQILEALNHFDQAEEFLSLN